MQLNNFKTVFFILFLNNGYWKLLALVIAIVVYFSISSDISHLKVISVPVEVTNDSTAGNAVIWSVEPRSVEVRIRGSYNEISEIADNSLTCTLRAKQKSSGFLDTVQVKIRSKDIQGVRNTRIVKIEPSTIDVKFDVPVSIPLAIAAPAIKGNARGSVKLSYDVTNAVVTGSRRLLQPLDVDNTRIQCEPIDVEGRLETFTTNQRLVPPGDAVSFKVEPTHLTVKVSIISEKASKVIESIPVVISQPTGSVNRWVTDPQFVNIEVSGRSELLKSVKFADIMASVDGNLPLVPGLTNEVPVMVHLRQGLEVDSVKPVPEMVNLIPVIDLKPVEPLTTN
jgi:hypothetical protein